VNLSFLSAPIWLIIFGVVSLGFAGECAFLIWNRWKSNTLKELEQYDNVPQKFVRSDILAEQV
jgi:hypothetical protein